MSSSPGWPQLPGTYPTEERLIRRTVASPHGSDKFRGSSGIWYSSKIHAVFCATFHLSLYSHPARVQFLDILAEVSSFRLPECFSASFYNDYAHWVVLVFVWKAHGYFIAAPRSARFRGQFCSQSPNLRRSHSYNEPLKANQSERRHTEYSQSTNLLRAIHRHWY